MSNREKYYANIIQVVLRWMEEVVAGDGGRLCTILLTKVFSVLDPFSRPHLLCFLSLMGPLRTESTDQGSLENVLPVNSCAFSLASSF